MEPVKKMPKFSKNLFKKRVLIDTALKEEKEKLRDLLLNPIKKASQKEIATTKIKIKVEKEWWKNKISYNDFKQIDHDIKKGFLKEIKSDKNFQLIMRLRNPELKDWMPYLEKDTATILKKIGIRWREKMRQEKLPEKIKLAISNLLVLDSYKKEAIKRGKLAVEGSCHSKGVSADIDGCGYYFNGISVNPRQTPNYTDIYIPRVHQILLEVLNEMKDKKMLNFIQEFPNSNNQSFHITRDPNSKKCIKKKKSKN